MNVQIVLFIGTERNLDRRSPDATTFFRDLLENQTVSSRAMITVESIDERTFNVTVTTDSTTNHTVTVEPDYAVKLTGGQGSTERLLEASFEFLLEREPNTSILRSFALPEIGQYFPKYESTIGQKL